jgi:hypothetical protein
MTWGACPDCSQLIGKLVSGRFPIIDKKRSYRKVAQRALWNVDPPVHSWREIPARRERPRQPANGPDADWSPLKGCLRRHADFPVLIRSTYSKDCQKQMHQMHKPANGNFHPPCLCTGSRSPKVNFIGALRYE